MVELSIVLVILGLLVGGILSGQSLIRAAELRSVTVEVAKYMTAVGTFRDKYFVMPGDMRNATSFWGRLNSNADCVTNGSAAVGSPGACDGNGDGIVSLAGGANKAGESYGFWQHLANAGLIEGSYSGLAGTINGWSTIPGTNTPKSKLSGGSWYFYPQYTTSTGSDIFDGTYTYWLQFGKLSVTDNAAPVLKPEEAWNIDTKLDDGMPGTGKITMRGWSTCTTATTSTQVSSPYQLSNTNVGCTLMAQNLF